MSPDVALPRAVTQLRADINPDLINSLTETDFGIWATPEDTTFVNGMMSFYLSTHPLILAILFLQYSAYREAK